MILRFREEFILYILHVIPIYARHTDMHVSFERMRICGSKRMLLDDTPTRHYTVYCRYTYYDAEAGNYPVSTVGPLDGSPDSVDLI